MLEVGIVEHNSRNGEWGDFWILFILCFSGLVLVMWAYFTCSELHLFDYTFLYMFLLKWKFTAKECFFKIYRTFKLLPVVPVFLCSWHSDRCKKFFEKCLHYWNKELLKRTLIKMSILLMYMRKPVFEMMYHKWAHPFFKLSDLNFTLDF